MEGFKRFSREKLNSLRARYRGDDLFRTWSRTLCMLEENFGELDAVEVWNETEMLRLHLSAIEDHGDNEIDFFFAMLRDRHLLWIDEKGAIKSRSRSQGEHTAIIILTVLFSQLSDANPDMEDCGIDRNPNMALCRALADKLMSPDRRDFVMSLLKQFASRKCDNEGNKIVLPVTDYMDVENVPESLGECEMEDKSGLSYDAVLERLRTDVFYGVKEDAAAFLERIRGLESGPSITQMVNKCVAEGLVKKEKSHRKLWRVLHEAGIYTHGESNWNSQVK